MDAMTREAPQAVVLEALREVLDPDLGVNVVDLGFVREVAFDGDVLRLTMTLTSASCPLTKVIEDQMQTALGRLAASSFAVTWEFLPPWTPDQITEEGREQLTAIGFSV